MTLAQFTIDGGWLGMGMLAYTIHWMMETAI